MPRPFVSADCIASPPVNKTNPVRGFTLYLLGNFSHDFHHSKNSSLLVPSNFFFFFFSITFYPVRFEIYISLSSLFLIFMNIRLETMFERLTLPLPPPPPPCLISNVQFCIYLRVTHTVETSIFGRDGSMENRTIDPE